MQVVVKGLLGLALLSALTSCRVNTTGLGGQDGSLVDIEGPGPDAASGAAGSIQPASGLAGHPGTGGAGTGAAGTSPVGTSGSAGTSAASAGTTGDAGDGGGAGTGAAAGTGEAGGGAAGTGEAGTGEAGAGAAGAGMAGVGAAGSGAAGAGGSTPDPHPISKIGCADDTREGFIDASKYPRMAACSGAWTVPGLVAPETLTPQCERRAGNDGVRADGAGCSVADLCSEGWHVCESISDFKMNATSCTDGYSPSGGTPVFFATRQRGTGMGTVTCDPKNAADGTNNIYGCGNIGSPADGSCAPFTRMLRDNDCRNNPPWACVDGPLNYNVLELTDVTKPGSARGGVLCCR